MQDTAGSALQLMEDLQLPQLPLIENEKYVGLIFESDLLQLNEKQLLSSLVSVPVKIAVHANTLCLEAIKTAIENRLRVIPVTEDEEYYTGSIHLMDLIYAWGKMTGIGDPGAVFVLETELKNYSVLEIAKIVAATDAQIRQLNTMVDAKNESMIITLQINKFEISELMAALQRHEYRIRYYFGEELYENELRANYEHLMNYLNI
jgi:CBS domain-containing protein